MQGSVATATCALAAAAWLGSAGAAAAETRVLNGFRLDPREIDVREILPGGPARDGIPALDHPPVVAAGDSSPWPGDAAVLGVAWNGAARAYPIAILVWHELVNDTLGGRPILVSYCPLCGTGIVFDRRFGGSERSFGVSGLLYRSDLLLYDRQSESLWSQIVGAAVTGPAQGLRLEQVRSRMTTWGRWREVHPESSVLSRATGHARNYAATPYGDYGSSERLFFPVPRDDRYHPKTPTLGLRVPGGAARAYPAPELVRAGGAVQESFAGQSVRVAYDAEQRSFDVEAPPSLEIVEGFWFAWAAFHPHTTVYTSAAPGGDPARGRGGRRSKEVLP